MKIQLLVVFGGKTVEHEISIISAIQAINHIDKSKYDIIPLYLTKELEFYTGENIAHIESYQNIEQLLSKSTRVTFAKEKDSVFIIEHSKKKFKKLKKRIDIAFPIVHGNNVEDGSIQGFLKTIGLPFIGCDVISSAAGMDKHIMKCILKDFSIPVLDCLVYNKYEYDIDPKAISCAIKEKLAFPLIIKPATLGSSIGISKANNATELEESLETAFSFATKIIVEPAITNLREINCSVVGDIEEAEASECEEPLNATTILSYEDKYMGSPSKSAKTSDSQGMASLVRQIPANIPDELRTEIRALAVKTFKSLGCNGISRIDFLLDVSTNSIYVNEINTIPGSLSFYLWEPLGISYTKLIDKLIQLCLKREREEKNLLNSFHTNVLSLCSSGSLNGTKNKVNI